MNEWFRSPAAWIVVGFAGQILFASRFIVQWWASERQRRVVIPTAFWILSAVGGMALFAYAIHKQDPVFAIGQGSGLLIYLRNLRIAHKSRSHVEGPRGAA